MFRRRPAFWRAVPRPIRRRLVGLLVAPIASGEPVDRSAFRLRAPIYVCGPFSGTSSFGWVSRDVFHHFSGRFDEVEVIDIAHLMGPSIPPPVRRDLAFKEQGAVVYVCNPDQIGFVRSMTAPDLWSRNYRIIHCAWELPRLDAAWLEPLSHFDEIWVPSEFVRDAMLKSGIDKPVVVNPHRLKLPGQISTGPWKETLPGGVRFLFAMHLASGFARKNPQGLVRAFLEATQGIDDAWLAIKTHGDEKWYPGEYAAMAELCASSDRLLHMHEDFSVDRMWGFIDCFDCIVSLHRSEGYGLLLKQAMMLKKRVIATGWSGNLDFMTADGVSPLSRAHLIDFQLVPVSDDSGRFPQGADYVWAQPDHADAVKKIRTVLTEIRQERRAGG